MRHDTHTTSTAPLTRKKVVIFHGLLCNATIMMPLNMMLKARGYECLSLTYPTRKQSLIASAQSLIPTIGDFAGNESINFVGHSLGGLLIRHLQHLWPQGFVNAKAVTLGTPHMGSKVADYFHIHHLRNKVLGESWHHALDGLAPDWDKDTPLLSIAGTRALGVGQTLKIFDENEPNDGLVAVSETRVPMASAFKEVAAPHTALSFSPTAADMIDQWLRD